MKKKKPNELLRNRNYRATNPEEALIKKNYEKEITDYSKQYNVSVKKAKKVYSYSRWKAARLLKLSTRVIV